MQFSIKSDKISIISGRSELSALSQHSSEAPGAAHSSATEGAPGEENGLWMLRSGMALKTNRWDFCLGFKLHRAELEGPPLEAGSQHSSPQQPPPTPTKPGVAADGGRQLPRLLSSRDLSRDAG